MFDDPGHGPRVSVEELERDDHRLVALLSDIQAREQLINQLQAEQVLAVAEYAEGRARLDFSDLVRWRDQERRICAAELADARGVGVHAAESHMYAALTLINDAPGVLGRLEAGVITVQAARAAADEVSQLHPELRPFADEAVAEEIDQILPGQVRSMARTRCLELDTDSAVEMAAHNRAQRYVQVGPSTMLGMACLTAPLPIEQAVACWESLDAHAWAARADGDARTVSQIMADTLVERVTGQVRSTDVPVEVALVMTDRTLLGVDDRPASIPGHGPVPAQIARSLAARDGTWVRRLLTDPIDDTVTAMESRRRRFRGRLRAFVKLRDQRCRGSGCTGKIRDGDHVDDYALGGLTSAGNGIGLCQRCHHLEDHGGLSCEAVGCAAPTLVEPGDLLDRFEAEVVRVQRAAAPALLRWRTPVGRTMVTQAPAALGLGTATLDQLRHRRDRRSRAVADTSDLEGSLVALTALHTDHRHSA